MNPSEKGALLGSLLLLCLQRLLAIASYHDNGEETADHGSEKNDQDDGNADGPDAREEKGVQNVVIVDKRLQKNVSQQQENSAMKCV